MNYKDILSRALKTFIEAFIPVVVAAFNIAQFDDINALKKLAMSTAISGVAAGITAVLNFILQLVKTKETVSVDTVEVEEYDDEGFDGAC